MLDDLVEGLALLDHAHVTARTLLDRLQALLEVDDLGQAFQRQPLQGLSAVVYTDGKPIDYPQQLLDEDTPAQAPPWRLFIIADTTLPACRELPRHYAWVRNRLAAWPEIQQRLRLTVLALDEPDATAIAAFAPGEDWIDVLPLKAQPPDPLIAALGILPTGMDLCTPLQLNAILVSPEQRRWALIPHEPAADMAHNIRTIVEFVE